MYHSGAGYQYEDPTILGFGHTAKGHWGGLHVQMLPATGRFSATDYASPYSHERESAHPGYYQVWLERYNVNAELTSTLRCAFHRYTFRTEDEKHLLCDMTHSNNDVRDWSIQRDGENAFTGSQNGEGRIFFYAVCNYPIASIVNRQNGGAVITDITFKDSRKAEPLLLKVGFSFVSVENARLNLEAEMLGKSFDEIRTEADATWEKELQKIRVEGGTQRQRGLFYSTLYRSLLWPSLRSDVNGEYPLMEFGNPEAVNINRIATGRNGQAQLKMRARGVGRVPDGQHRYTVFSLWDTCRNLHQLLTLLYPEKQIDMARSVVNMYREWGWMPKWEL
jgi:putative alpha-1,2-mannosidase